ncbi:General secretion pathway protein E [Desulfamplus magnetovallimortis]|uniref:protein-secreting ATPase n=1 Tax=Desulfamplus magnetovallimortis TaxID=1246637 RepID=A0A1W1HL41_9BACT|nr:type II secretion system ATPase GspE [Desulfamplus magnetovallimortis]SLM33227.1 General secretion pathway protein E [Desulfamplus magnetovallimortis]
MFNTFLQLLSKETSISRESEEKIVRLYLKNRDDFMEAMQSSGIVEEIHILSVMSKVFSIPLLNEIDHADPSLLSILNEKRFTETVSSQFLKKLCMAPVSMSSTSPSASQIDDHDSSSSVSIALNNPIDLSPADEIARILGIAMPRFYLAPKGEILSAINHIYSETEESTRRLVENMEENGKSIIKEIQETSDLLDDTSDAPVIRLVNHMISQSVKANASDIHIEPFQDTIKIRYRIDGILYDLLEPPKWIQSALISRVKVMADMDIAEKRVPQDGRIEVRLGQQKIDIRVSTVPTSFGERLVMRLLNKSGNLLELSQSGISREALKTFNRLITINNGIILVTGPTGSGKTTTLYAALSSINSPDKNIITIEDPVEYNLKGIGQIQVNRKIGMTFAKGLRSIVRQDPDVILVGEIRDLETAEIAIQSALTGHLVFSTLHTNDSAGAVTRLVDLGVEPYLITSSVKAVAAQRLVRILCSNCKVPYNPDKGERVILDLENTHSKPDSQPLNRVTIFKARGCPQCFNTGYTGRQAIFEIMELNESLKNKILTTSDANQIKQEALSRGMTTLRQDGVNKVLQGITSVEEVLRVTQE